MTGTSCTSRRRARRYRRGAHRASEGGGHRRDARRCADDCRRRPRSHRRARRDHDATAERALRAALPPVLAPFRLAAADSRLREVIDQVGTRHFRFAQTRDGLDVIGAHLVVHVERSGVIVGATGSARGELAPAPARHITPADARHWVASNPQWERFEADSRLVYLAVDDGAMRVAYEVVVAGGRADPCATRSTSTSTAARSSRCTRRSTSPRTARCTAPTTARRAGHAQAQRGPGRDDRHRRQRRVRQHRRDVRLLQATSGTATRTTTPGATLISTVHYTTNYCNAYWDGTQMVYGDGDASRTARPLARSAST